MLTASYHPFPGAIRFFVSWEVDNPLGSGNTTVYATSDACAREFFRRSFGGGYQVCGVSRHY